MKKYAISNYNKHICLKANGLMTVISLYLLKPYLIAAASVVYRGSNSALDTFYPNKLIVSLEAAAAIPVIFLVFAWARRAPGAAKIIKYLCRNGKTLIMTTAFLQLCITSSPLWPQIDNTMTRLGWIQLLLLLLIIVVTALSTYMRDCFSDFPEPDHDDI